MTAIRTLSAVVHALIAVCLFPVLVVLVLMLAAMQWLGERE